ncbi:MAG: hypothetical protein IH867_09780 [Chloroflexi bacterium]|nr:hypothetical protein [Chloroflexota bacterium]
MNTETKWLRTHEFLEENPQMGRNTLFALARSGDLITVRVGRRLLIRSDALDVLAKAQLAEKQTAAVHTGK